MMERLTLRPHHGICIQCFEGKGYCEDFVQNMTKIVESLKKNPDCIILLKSETDDLCKVCPHNKNGICETENKVKRYDEKCLALCGLESGDSLPWREFEQLVMQKILLSGRLSEVCGDCSWSDICQRRTVENIV